MSTAARFTARLACRFASLVFLSVLFILPAQAGTGPAVFINEVHYDNTGTDTGEFIEIAGPAGTDLATYSIVLYNGATGLSYDTDALSGTIPNQQNGFGTVSLSYPVNGIQNGSPDGIALVNGTTVIQFLSYEGSFLATNGPASGMTSIDIGVSENGSELVGLSLQLQGTGTTYDDFTWAGPIANTQNAINTGQTFPGVATPGTLQFSNAAYEVSEDAGNAIISVTRLAGNSGAVSVSYTTGDGTATPGADYTTASGTIDFEDGDSSTKTFMVPILEDTLEEDSETVTLTLSGPTNGATLGSPSTAVLTIHDNDAQIDVIINEVDSDTPGTDVLEFVELYDGGIGNTPLDGLVVVFYNGNGDVSYASFDLDGRTTDANGYFTLGNSAVAGVDLIFNGNLLQNGQDAVAIYEADATDFPNGTAVTTAHLIDAFVYDTNDADDPGLLVLLNSGQPQVDENGGGSGDTQSSQRCPNGTGGARNTNTYRQFAPTPDAANTCGVATAIALKIHEIQGDGLASPHVGQLVETTGNIVTALDSNGFFLQMPDGLGDGEVLTSDGIFVFTGSAPTVQVGNEVTVEGEVREFFTMTEIVDPTVTLIGSGRPLPAAVVLDEDNPPTTGPATHLERYEGMLVRVLNGTATAPSDRFGDLAMVARSTRAYREPGADWDGNPEIFEIDPNALGLPEMEINGGSTIDLVEGPLSFAFGDYQIWPKVLNVTQASLPRAVRERNAGEMTIASQNLLRMFDLVNDPGVDDDTPTAAEYASRLSKISKHIREVLGSPDVVAVEEVENIGVLEDIADKLFFDDATAIYTPYLLEGNDVGGIDVGFLARHTVRVDSVEQFGEDDLFSGDTPPSLLNDRPPLVLRGAYIGNGAPFPIAVVVVHQRSLNGIETIRVQQKRQQQAERLAELLDQLQAVEGNRVAVVGDFNAFEFSDGFVDVMNIVTTNPEPDFTNQVMTLPAEERYSFIFEGSAQTLDHALTNVAWQPFFRELQFGRGNADAPEVWFTDATTPLRTADHDGLVLFTMTDWDADGFPDDEDECSQGDTRATVFISSCDSGVPNLSFGECTLADELEKLADGHRNHGQYVSAVAHYLNELRKQGLISNQQKGQIEACAARRGD
jgi:hypothetical protein